MIAQVMELHNSVITVKYCLYLLVGKLLIGFQDVALLCSRAIFSNTFLNNCGRGESLVATTCLKSVVGVSICMLLVKYFCSN